MPVTDYPIRQESDHRLMTAVVQARYGSADALAVTEIELPAFGPDEVLLEVRAAGIDRGVEHLMTGLPYLVRLVGYGLRRPKQPVPGLDVSGRVIAVGSDVTRFRVGEEVFGIGTGTFAELASAPESKLVHKPAEIDHRAAAVTAISGLTALQAVEDVGRVRRGQQVLVLGASGGVGSFAVQIAKAAGAEVTGVASGSKLDLVRSLGADHVVDYGTTDVTAGAARFDLIIDVGGRTRLRKLRRVLAPKGTLVIVGGEGGGRFTGGIGRQLRALVLSPFVGHRLTTFVSSENHRDIERLRVLLTSGDLVPAVDRTYRLDEVPEAMRDLEAGRIRGKAVVTVGSAG